MESLSFRHHTGKRDMKRYLFLIALFVHQANAQTFNEHSLNTTIKEVTVFLQGAQINRAGKTTIPSGKSIILVKSLSPYVDEKSIQVKAEGPFTILSVNHKLNFLDQLKKGKKTDSLRLLIDEFDLKIARLNSRQEILREKQSLLNENKNLGGFNSGVTLTELEEAMSFYDQALSDLKSEELNNKYLIEESQKLVSKYAKQIADVNTREEKPMGEIEIRVEAKTRIEAEFQISYLVKNAGWFPKYDVRVKDVENPISLDYKANVYQNTGIDWENVKLKFSNGNPNQSGTAPELSAWYLNYARNTIYQYNDNNVSYNAIGSVSGRVIDENGEGLPGAKILVKGTTVGAVTDLNGNYSITLPNNNSQIVISYIGYMTEEISATSSTLNVQLQPDLTQLSEVVVRGLSGRVSGVNVQKKNLTYGVSRVEAESITTTTIENQTTVEFEVPEPYSIKSNGETLSVDLKQFEIPAVYKYYAVPKLDKDAFLIARIYDWDKYNLLEGEANLYFESAYVGRTILNAKALVDTLDISLGRDKSIVVGRTKIDSYSRRRTLGTNKIENRGFEILVRNKKSSVINMTVFDQIPVSVVDNINVSVGNISNGLLAEDTGIVKWELQIPSNEQTKLDLEYEVKYPKWEKVVLE